MLLIKKSQKQPSYFDGMEIGDELPIINRENIHVKFEKSSNESGILHLNVANKLKRDMEIEYDFENFPTMREQFIKRIRYIFLRDFSVPQFQNEDLKDTKLSLVKDLELGYGLRVVKTSIDDVPAVEKIMRKLSGHPSDEEVDVNQLLPKETLRDFVYTIYAKKGENNIPLGIFGIPFNLADEIYDLNSLDEIRDFFIDLAETALNVTIQDFAKELAAKHNIKDIAGAFERLDSGNLTSKDILDFYNEQSKNMQPGSDELKQLHAKVESLIRRLHEGETITKEDLNMVVRKPSMVKPQERVKDYRKLILVSRLDKDLARVEYMFETRLKGESDEAKVSEIRAYYFNMKKKISELRVIMDQSKDIQPVISDINAILANAADFIKK